MRTGRNTRPSKVLGESRTVDEAAAPEGAVGRGNELAFVTPSERNRGDSGKEEPCTAFGRLMPDFVLLLQPQRKPRRHGRVAIPRK